MLVLFCSVQFFSLVPNVATSSRALWCALLNVALLSDLKSIVSTSSTLICSHARGYYQPLWGRGEEDKNGYPSIGLTLGESVYFLEFQESYKELCCARVGKRISRQLACSPATGAQSPSTHNNRMMTILPPLPPWFMPETHAWTLNNMFLNNPKGTLSLLTRHWEAILKWKDEVASDWIELFNNWISTDKK